MAPAVLMLLVAVVLGPAAFMAVHAIRRRSFARAPVGTGRAAPRTGVSVLLALAIALPMALVAPLIDPRSLGAYVAIYFVVWWIMLFVALPIGVRSQQEVGEVVPGSDPGAPVLPDMGLKAVFTTVVANSVFAGMVAVYGLKLVSLDTLARFIGVLR